MLWWKRHPRIAALLGDLEPYQLDALIESIRRNDQAVRIFVHKGQIIAGWHIYLACQELGKTPEIVQVGGTEDDALAKALSVELSRRHIDKHQVAAIWFEAAKCIKPIKALIDQAVAEAKARRNSQLKRGSARSAQLDRIGESAAEIGRRIGVSGSTVKRISALSPTWRTKLAAGETDFNHARQYSIRERNRTEAAKCPPVNLGEIRILQSDFRELDVPINVPLILCDPPYDDASLPLYLDAAKIAARHLDKERGFLLAYSGIHRLPKVIELLSAHLNYYWQLVLPFTNTSGHVRARIVRRVRNCYRPVLAYCAGPRANPPKVFVDCLKPRNRQKEWHPMQQPLEDIITLVEHFTRPGDLVVDLCGGAFTGAIACYHAKRRYLGCDIDSQAVKDGQLRLRKFVHEAGYSDK